MTRIEVAELEPWLAWHEHNKGHSRSTCYNYRMAIRRYAEWMREQGIALEAAKPELVQRYAGEVLHTKGQSPHTRRIAVSALRGFYRWLAERRKVKTSPAAMLPFPRKSLKLPLPIPADDVSRLLTKPDLATFKGIRDMAILSVLLGCGPRVSGVSALNESDLIFTRADNGMEDLTIRFREKGRNERLVPAPEETRLMVRAYLGHTDLDACDLGTATGETVLFVNLRNRWVPAHDRRGEARRISEGSIFDMIQKYGRAAGVEPRFLHPHAFRHLYGAELAENDIDVLTRQQLMGHRSVASTEIYTHVAFRKLRAAALKGNPMRRVKHPATQLGAMLKAGLKG